MLTAFQRSALVLVGVLLLLAVAITGLQVLSDASPPAQPEVGKDWNVIATPAFKDGNPRAIAVGGPGLVAVGSAFSNGTGAAAVWTSPNGLIWERVPDVPAFHDSGMAAPEMTGVVTGGPGLVAVGGVLSPMGQHPAVWTSADGLAWRRVPDVPALEGERMSTLVRGGPGFVAVGGGGRGAAIWTSPDGLSWTRLPSTAALDSGNLTTITAGGPGLVAAGSTVSDPHTAEAAPVWTSPDGLAWSRIRSADAFHDGDISGITVGGPGLVAVGIVRSGGRARPAAWMSADGLTWARVPVQIPLGFSGSHMVAVIARPGGPGLVAVGLGPKGVVVWNSLNGSDWQLVPHKPVFDSSTVDAIGAGGPGLIAVGSRGIWVSPASPSPVYRVPVALLFVVAIVGLLLLAARATRGKPRSAFTLAATLSALLFLVGEAFGDQIGTFLYEQFGQIGP